MTTQAPEDRSEDSQRRYSYRLTAGEIQRMVSQRRWLKSLAAVGLIICGVVTILLGMAPFSLTNRLGLIALPAFLMLYLAHFLITPFSRPINPENMLVIGAQGLGFNDSFVHWEWVETAELKTRRGMSSLQLDVATMREGYTAPARSTLIIAELERYGAPAEIITEINRHLKEPVVDKS